MRSYLGVRLWQRTSIVLGRDTDLNFFDRPHGLVLVLELLVDDAVDFDDERLIVSYGTHRVGLFGIGADDEAYLSFLQ